MLIKCVIKLCVMNLLDLFCDCLMDAEIRQRLSEVIKKARGSRSQRQFAKALGVSYGAVRSWEECESLPGLESMEAIAQTLGYSLEDFIAHIRGANNASKPPRPRRAEDALYLIEDLPQEEVQKLTKLLVDKLACRDKN